MSSRREFFKAVGGGTVALATISCEPVINQQPPRREGDASKRYGMLIDLEKCIGCQACTMSCNIENETPIGQFRTTVDQYEFFDAQNNVTNVMLPRLCNHCDNAPCIPVCPVEATFQREDGIVVIDNERCVGCAYCVQACPYNARFINEETNTADKCTFCEHRLEDGLLPACVESCVGGARVIGDLKDPESTISKTLVERGDELRVLKKEAGTIPRVYYLGLDKAFDNEIKGQESLW